MRHNIKDKKLICSFCSSSEQEVENEEESASKPEDFSGDEEGDRDTDRNPTPPTRSRQHRSLRRRV